MKFNHELNIPFSAPLQEDSESETKGCRHTNPDICGSNSLEGICAFVRKDCICKKPSSAWKKQFKKLRGKQIKIWKLKN